VRNKLGLLLLIAATGGALWGVDVFLARTERAELSGEAQRDFEQGSALLKSNQPAQAIEPLRKARSLDRDNREYAVALAAALSGAGKFDEEGELLQELLGRDPNDGEANLLEARLQARSDGWEEAFAYYHRAIYGSWGADAAARRITVRVELANLLAERVAKEPGDQKDLLAELLPLESEAAGDVEIERQVAHLYLLAGSPARAEELYRSLHLPIASEAAALDPMRRYLSAAEKFRRSERILELVRDSVAKCGVDVSSADDLLSEKIRGEATNELAEERLSMAEKLWQSKSGACGGGDEALELVMAKLQGAR